MKSDLVEKLVNGALLLTPTRRLASASQLSAAHSLRASYRVWDTLKIHSLEDWYRLLWDQYEMTGQATKQLLSVNQSLLLLEQIIKQTSAGESILAPYETAKTLYSAWKVLNQWLSLDLLEKTDEQLDRDISNNWLTDYQTILQQKHFIDGAMLPQELLLYLEAEGSQSIIFYGFEEKTPWLEYFANRLEALGWIVEWAEPEPISPDVCVRHAFFDEEQEHHAAIEFALERHRAGDKQIAIIVPQLADYRSRLDRAMKNAIDPLAVITPISKIYSEFNISAAIPLVQYPLVNTALLCLKLATHDITLADYLRLISSPWLHPDNEDVSRLYPIYQEMKQYHRGHLTLSDILHYLSLNRISDPWKEKIQWLVQIIQSHPKDGSYYSWSLLFRKILHHFQWPTKQTLSSIEYQSVMRFYHLLDELSECDSVLSPCHYFQAWQTLQKLASYIPFQAENKGAPIQILGVLEAAGQSFDAIWVMGMQNEAWPSKASPNPFIDLNEQRLRHMPHSSAERERLYAQRMTERFQVSAKRVIFSYAQGDKEKRWEGSPLIEAIPLAPYELQSEHRRLKHKITSFPIEKEHVNDYQAPPVAKTEPIKPTTRLIELQAHCPFRAFAEYRLQAKPIQSKSLWLQSQEQGSLLHAILEHWWRRFPKQSDLIQLNEEQRREQLAKIASPLFEKYFSKKHPTFYREIEMQRMLSLLEKSFELELKRKPFIVLNVEYQTQYTLGELTFSIRCDRIDQDSHKNEIIIDYKTGKFSLSDWQGKRLLSPQLPFYATAYESTHLMAIMVVQLKADEANNIGYMGEEIGIPQLTYDAHFADNKVQWRQDLLELVEEFTRGHAKVDPVKGRTTCQFCHLKSLCRIQELE